MFKKLKVYADATHPHVAQNPVSLRSKVGANMNRLYATGRRKLSLLVCG